MSFHGSTWARYIISLQDSAIRCFAIQTMDEALPIANRHRRKMIAVTMLQQKNLIYLLEIG